MWCAPWFKLDDVGPASTRQDIGTANSAFFLKDVISPAEAARMVAVADSMGFDRPADAERERQNGALSWVLHAELEAQLLRRLAPHLPWCIAVHAPGSPAPALGDLSTPPWVRLVEGAPAGQYVLAGLSARSRVYRYESDGRDAFKPHYDEVWPGSTLGIGIDGGVDGDSQMHSDGWRYSSAPKGQWAWLPGHRVSHLSVLLYLSDDFEGGETLLHFDDGDDDGTPRVDSSRVSVTPITGSALCFGQSFRLGRARVSHGPDAVLHEGLPLRPVAAAPPRASAPTRAPTRRERRRSGRRGGVRAADKPPPPAKMRVKPAAGGSRPLFMKPAAKYVLRTDVQYTMPLPPDESLAAACAETSGVESGGDAADEAADESRLKDPQAAQSMTIELSDDPVTRAKQLELLKEYGYDVSQFM